MPLVVGKSGKANAFPYFKYFSWHKYFVFLWQNYKIKDIVLLTEVNKFTPGVLSF